MVFTAGQTRDFFEDNDQMEHDTFLQLMNEGIQTVDSLADFDEDSLKQVAAKLSKPSGRIPDPTIGVDGGAVAGSTTPHPPFTFSAKFHVRLIAATKLLKFYNTIGHPIDAAGMRWDQVMKNFNEQWQAIEDNKEKTAPDVPTITKGLTIIKWIESFQDHCYRCIGQRNIPLAYVIRETVAVPALCPDRLHNQPFSQVHGSILDDMINRASHTHGLYPQDNAAVYFKMEEASRGTPFADSIKTYQRRKDGRGAYFAIVAQFAGNDKWEAEIKKSTTILHQRKWKGSQNFTLEKFVALHRNAYVSLQACATHVQYQLPNEHSRVGYVLDAIESDDAPLRAAIANIEDDTGVGGKRGDFEAAVAYMLPKDPVVKRKQQDGKRPASEISDVKAELADFGSKPGIGKTGVHLRYHNNTDYKKLSKPQQDELREWRKQDPENRSGDKKSPTKKQFIKSDKAMAASIKKGMEKALAEREKKAEKDEEGRAYLMSMIAEAVGGKGAGKGAGGNFTAISSSTTAAPSKANVLNSILKKAQAASKKKN
jgi:hypothetical protein